MSYLSIINISRQYSVLNVLCVSLFKNRYLPLRDSTFRFSVFHVAGNLKYVFFKVLFSFYHCLNGFYGYFAYWIRYVLNSSTYSLNVPHFVFFKHWHHLFFARYLRPVFFMFYYRLLYSNIINYFRVLITSSKRNTFCCIYDSNGKMRKLFTVGQDKDFRKSKKRVWLAHSKLADRLYFCIRKFALDHRFYFFIKLKSLRSQNKVVLKKLLKNLSYYWKSVNKRRRYIHL